MGTLRTRTRTRTRTRRAESPGPVSRGCSRARRGHCISMRACECVFIYVYIRTHVCFCAAQNVCFRAHNGGAHAHTHSLASRQLGRSGRGPRQQQQQQQTMRDGHYLSNWLAIAEFQSSGGQRSATQCVRMRVRVCSIVSGARRFIVGTRTRRGQLPHTAESRCPTI